jgi:hypothetical protein
MTVSPSHHRLIVSHSVSSHGGVYKDPASETETRDLSCMNHNDDIDADCQYYVVQRFIDGLRAGGRPVPKQVTDWCLKIKLNWEIAADGSDSRGDPEQLQVYGTGEVASILNVTRRQVRNLVNDLDAQKSSGVWVFPKQAVLDYAKERKWPTPTQRHSS